MAYHRNDSELVECGFCDTAYDWKTSTHDTLECAKKHAFVYSEKFGAKLRGWGLEPSGVASCINLRKTWEDKHKDDDVAG